MVPEVGIAGGSYLIKVIELRTAVAFVAQPAGQSDIAHT